LWFVDPDSLESADHSATRLKVAFATAMAALAKKVQHSLKQGGHCVLVVGEKVTRKGESHPALVAATQMSQHAPSLTLVSVTSDEIPDVRRSRRDYSGTKKEQVLVFRKAASSRQPKRTGGKPAVQVGR
jgi:hypothetical protein